MLKGLSLIKGFPWVIPPKDLYKVRKSPEVNSFEYTVSKVSGPGMQFLSKQTSVALCPECAHYTCGHHPCLLPLVGFKEQSSHNYMRLRTTYQPQIYLFVGAM